MKLLGELDASQIGSHSVDYTYHILNKNSETQMKKMLDLLILIFWLVFGAYSLWFLFKAETFQPMTLEDLALTWKLHKQQTKCTASQIHDLIIKNKEIVGFKCECGYEFLQKRLITQKTKV